MKLTFDYDLGGTMAKRTAHGVLHVKATQRDAGGATQATCDSGRIAFSATTG